MPRVRVLKDGERTNPRYLVAQLHIATAQQVDVSFRVDEELLCFRKGCIPGKQGAFRFEGQLQGHR